jgi:MFS family permease
MTYYTIFGSRFLAGVYSGLFSGILPLYLSECSCKNLRGITGAMNQFSIVIGILVANIIGLKQLLGTNELWPFLVALTFVPAIIHLCLLFTSESPKYLFINKDNRPKAEEGNVIF